MEDTASTRGRSSSIMINKSELELLLHNLGLKGAYCHDDDSHSCPDTRTLPITEPIETQSTCSGHENVRRSESSDSLRLPTSRKNSARLQLPTLERLPTVMQQTDAKLFPDRRCRTTGSASHLLMRATTHTDDFLVRLDARQEKLLKQNSPDGPIDIKTIIPSFGRMLLDEYDPNFRSRAATNPEKTRQKRQPQDTVFDISDSGQHLPVLNGRTRARANTTKREPAVESFLSKTLCGTGNDSDRSVDSLFSSSADDDRLRNLKLS
uniref:Uncharacterized protein n=1 Tax=Plectus sambesii TaxID=2011161 RepID=A0A914UYV4_9BILA